MSRKLRHRSHHGVHEGVREDMDSEQQQEPEAELKLLAYEYWQERGSPLGSPEEDWFHAEEELQRREEAATRL